MTKQHKPNTVYIHQLRRCHAQRAIAPGQVCLVLKQDYSGSIWYLVFGLQYEQQLTNYKMTVASELFEWCTRNMKKGFNK